MNFAFPNFKTLRLRPEDAGVIRKFSGSSISDLYSKIIIQFYGESEYLRFIDSIYDIDLTIQERAIADWFNLNAICLINSHINYQYIVYAKNELAFDNICIAVNNFQCDVFQYPHKKLLSKAGSLT